MGLIGKCRIGVRFSERLWATSYEGASSSVSMGFEGHKYNSAHDKKCFAAGRMKNKRFYWTFLSEDSSIPKLDLL